MEILLTNEHGKSITAYVTVTDYTPETFMLITGSGYGDCEPPDVEDIDYYLSETVDGQPSDYLMSLVTDKIHSEILMKYKA